MCRPLYYIRHIITARHGDVALAEAGFVQLFHILNLYVKVHKIVCLGSLRSNDFRSNFKATLSTYCSMVMLQLDWNYGYRI